MTDAPHITELFDLGLLAEMVDSKYIQRFEHNNGDLVGYNYTHNAQWDRVWNPATHNCRGLIVDTDGNIIARPFPKFFNHGERPEEDATRIGQPFKLFEKLDGSLGIHYQWQGQHAIATRGSFHSEQAQWATGHYNEHMAPRHVDDPATTYLFEIIYPENRIVVDYGDRAGLWLLAALDKRTGLRSEQATEFKQTEGFDVAPGDYIEDVKDRFAELDDGNFEGLVAEYPDGHRVKIKLDQYVRLHRIMSSTSNRTIWEALRAGDDIATVFESVPDEFYQWAKGTAELLQLQFDMIEESYRAHFDSLFASSPFDLHDPANRGAYAEKAKATPMPGILFAMLDGKSYADIIWKMLRPEELEYPPLGGGAIQDVAS